MIPTLNLTLCLCVNRLKLMCRKQSEAYRYKPLGVLKHNMATQPTYGKTNTHITTTGVLHRNPIGVLVYTSPYGMTHKVYLHIVK